MSIKYDYFKNKWSIWLQIKPKLKKIQNSDFSKGLINFVQFKNIKELYEIIELSPLSKPSNLFYDTEKSYEKLIKLNIEDNEYTHEDCNIDNIMLFKEGIKPVWEDKINKSGGHLVFELKNISKEEFNGIYKHIIIDIVGEKIPGSEFIVGFRFLDRLYISKNIKLEIWLSTTKKLNENVINDISERFEQIILKYFKEYIKFSFYFESHNKL